MSYSIVPLPVAGKILSNLRATFLSIIGIHVNDGSYTNLSSTITIV